jgi:flagellar hook-basal body complex protein FliE
MEKDERHTHESFGQIRFSRSQGRANFYGSELEQDHYINMELHQSEVQRTLSQDWYFTKGAPLVAIRMTSMQFAEIITSLNHGSGACCTIEIANQKKIDALPKQESRKEFVHRKFEERMTKFADEIRQKQTKAKELVKKKTLSKADIHELTIHLDWLTQEVEKNIPFFGKCFQENMDEVVMEAKMEVENAIQHKISILGLTELHNQNKLLSDGEKK